MQFSSGLNLIFQGKFSDLREIIGKPPFSTLQHRIFNAYILLQEGEHRRGKEEIESIFSSVGETSQLYPLGLAILSEANFKTGELRQSIAFAQKLQKWSTANRSDDWLVIALYREGIALIQHGETEEGIKLLKKADGIVNEAVMPYFKGLILNGIGYGHYERADFRIAKSNYNQAAKIFGNLGLTQAELGSMINVANVYGMLGDLKQAKAIYEEIALKSQSERFMYGLFLATSNLGAIYKNMGQFDLAIMQYSISLELSSKISNIVHLSQIQHDLAEIYFYSGKYGLSLGMIENALGIREKIGSKKLIAESLFLKGLILSKLRKGNRDIIDLLNAISQELNSNMVILMSKTLLLERRQLPDEEIDRIRVLIHDPKIELGIRLTATFIVIQYLLSLLGEKKQVEVSIILEIISLLDDYISFAETQGSIFHKVQATLIKAHLYALKGELLLAKNAIILAEALIREFDLWSFKDYLLYVKSLNTPNHSIPEFEEQILEQMGLKEDLEFVYGFSQPEPVVTAFLISNSDNIELYHLNFKGEEVPSVFIAGLLFTATLVQKMGMDLQVNEIELADFRVLYQQKSGINYWLIVKGEPSNEVINKFSSCVEQLDALEFLHQKTDIVVLTREDESIMDGIILGALGPES